MWNAFAGYWDVYGKHPTAPLVRRVRSWIAAVNEYEQEQYEKQQEEIEKANREAKQQRARYG